MPQLKQGHTDVKINPDYWGKAGSSVKFFFSFLYENIFKLFLELNPVLYNLPWTFLTSELELWLLKLGGEMHSKLKNYSQHILSNIVSIKQKQGLNLYLTMQTENVEDMQM